MRFLPRFPLYTAALAVAASGMVILGPSAASAQEVDLTAWAQEVGKNLDPVPCEPSEGRGQSLQGKPWHVGFNDYALVHQHSTGKRDDGEPVVVAVIDSGTNAEHPTFGDNVITGADPYDPGTEGKCDLDGHGTAVAGVIAGGHDDTSFVGVAPDASIMPFRLYPVGDEGGNNPEISRQIAATIVKAIEAGADVVNVSIASMPTPELEAAVDFAWDNGVLVVAATGNEGLDMDESRNGLAQKDQVYYPAGYDKALAIGGMDRLGNLYVKQNYGPQMDLIAPGVDISMPDKSSEGYVTMEGTSYAAPHVSGTVALLIARFGDIATPEWVTQRLIDTATPPSNGWNEYQGYGVLNIANSLTAPMTVEDDDDTPAADIEPESLSPLRIDYDPLATEKKIMWASVGGTIAIITLVLVLKRLIPKGRRRGWKPGTRSPVDQTVRAGENH